MAISRGLPLPPALAEAVAIRPEEARRERVRREKARRNLVDFSTYVAPWYRPGRHHLLVARYLHEVMRFIQTRGAEGIGRLMIFQPPRHGKTEQAAQLFPAWVLGRRPDTRVILTAYGADLAQRSSRAIRNYVQGDRYRAVFGDRSTVDAPVELAQDSRAVSNWDLAEPHRGGVLAAGVGGGITGAGAHLGIIDDPFKNQEQSESETYRESIWGWYGSSFYTRLEDGAAVVVMHTRWHQDDLAGRLLKQMLSDPLADRWSVLNLPALAYGPDELAVDEAHQQRELGAGLWRDLSDPLERAPGEALWPEKFDAPDLARIQANLDGVNPLDWPALYQQLPRLAVGAFYDPMDFEIVEAAPEGLRWFCYVDLALSTKQTADFNTALPTAMAPDGTVFHRDMLRVRGWTEFKEQLAVRMTSDLEAGTVWGIEDVAFQALALQELLADPRLAGVTIMAVRPEGDKVTRARSHQARAKAGKVRLVRGPWNTAFVAEAAQFPTGRHDDQVDTAAGGLKMVASNSGNGGIFV